MKTLELRVGLFVLFALFILLYGWSWLKSFSLFDKPQRFACEFTDIAGLSRNATVNVQGVRVGTVEYIEFRRPSKKILVHLKITDPTAHVPQGSKVTIQTLGLVGAKYVEIVLPRDANGNVIEAPEIANDAILTPPEVENPVRIELVMNRVATRVDEIVTSIDATAAGEAINNLNAASQKLNKNMDRLKDAAVSVQTASNNIANTSSRFGKTADNATIAAERASKFFSQGNITLQDIDIVARDFHGTSGRINKLLDNPALSGDLREAMLAARQTAETVRAAIGDVNVTLKDKELRSEMLGILQRLETSTNNIKSSMEIVQRMSADQGLRSDLKEVVRGAKEAMEKANNLLADPNFKEHLTTTMSKVRSAATNVDIASRQIQQVLNKRAPLLQLLFGKPGKLKVETTAPPIVVPATTVPPANCAPTPGAHP